MDIKNQAQRVAQDFSKVYRTARNTCGKERVLIYGNSNVSLLEKFK